MSVTIHAIRYVTMRAAQGSHYLVTFNDGDDRLSALVWPPEGFMTIGGVDWIRAARESMDVENVIILRSRDGIPEQLSPERGLDYNRDLYLAIAEYTRYFGTKVAAGAVGHGDTILHHAKWWMVLKIEEVGDIARALVLANGERKVVGNSEKVTMAVPTSPC